MGSQQVNICGPFECVTSHVMWQRGKNCVTPRGYLPDERPLPPPPPSRSKIGHLVVDVLEPLFYAMLEMVGGDLSLWDTDVILGELLGSFFSSRCDH